MSENAPILENSFPLPHRKASKKRRGQAAATVQTYNAEELRQAHKDLVAEHRFSQKTRTNYDGHVARGQEFLNQLCTLKEKEHEWLRSQGDDTLAQSFTDVSSGLPLHDPEFRHALTGHPNKYSVEALVMYLAQKCGTEGKGSSTADGVHAAFKRYWEEQDDMFNGPWRYDENLKCWRGNPTSTSVVQDLMKSIKHKCNTKGTVRQHSLAMSYNHMEKIMEWSESVCPVKDISMPPATVEEHKLTFKHLQMRAFFSTGFTLFTRNDELVNLRARDITFRFGSTGDGPSPYNIDHFLVGLSNRKGWQKKLDNNRPDLMCNQYAIYDQPDKPPINCFRHMLRYLTYLQLHVLNRPLEPDDYIFPAIGANGVLQPGDHVSSATVQSWLDDAVIKSNITMPPGGRFSLHCFRRGGAQYRFMYAPIGERWTLNRIHWWGGWAEGEQNDTTLIKYLLDELHMCEEHHSHALRPVQDEVKVSLLGEHKMSMPATTADVQASYQSLSRDLHEIKCSLTGLSSRIGSVEEKICTPTTQIFHTYPVNQPVMFNPAASRERQPLQTIERVCVTNQQVEANHWQSQPVQSQFTVSLQSAAPIAPVITPGISIPDVPLAHNGRKDRKTSLFDIVSHWDRPDRRNGLECALKDWPRSWYTGVNRRLATKYSQRKVIALEYIETYNRDEAAFKAAYPGWATGSTYLLRAINEAREERGALIRRVKVGEKRPREEGDEDDDGAD